MQRANKIQLILIMLIGFFFFSADTSARIVWSPETGWELAGKAPRGTPDEQLKRGDQQFRENNYEAAFRTYYKLYQYYPRSDQAPEALYKAGECLIQWKYYKKALKIFERLLVEYPSSNLAGKAIQKEFEIGMHFYEGARRKMWGVQWFRSYSSGIQAFKTVIANDPFGEYSDDSMFYIGLSSIKMEDYEQAIEHLEQLQDKFPDSPFSGSCEYYIARCLFEGNKGQGYSMNQIATAIKRLQKYLDLFPDGNLSNQAVILLGKARDMQAGFYYKTARFYESWKKYRSAEVYYEIILKNFSDMDWKTKADNRLKIIRPRIKS